MQHPSPSGEEYTYLELSEEPTQHNPPGVHQYSQGHPQMQHHQGTHPSGTHSQDQREQVSQYRPTARTHTEQRGPPSVHRTAPYSLPPPQPRDAPRQPYRAEAFYTPQKPHQVPSGAVDSHVTSARVDRTRELRSMEREPNGNSWGVDHSVNQFLPVSSGGKYAVAGFSYSMESMAHQSSLANFEK